MNHNKWASVTVLKSIKIKIEKLLENNPDYASVNNFVQIALLNQLQKETEKQMESNIGNN